MDKPFIFLKKEFSPINEMDKIKNPLVKAGAKNPSIDFDQSLSG
jgi:hypothetical protein